MYDIHRKNVTNISFAIVNHRPTAIKKLKSAWFCALSKIFQAKGSNVDAFGEMCEGYTFETEVANRQDRFCTKLTMMNSPLFIPLIASHAYSVWILLLAL